MRRANAELTTSKGFDGPWLGAMRRSFRLVSFAVLACGAMGFCAFSPSSAAAIVQGPQWTITSVSRPTNFAPGDQSGEDSYQVLVTNTGGASSDGSPVLVTDEMPEGLSLAPGGASGEDRLSQAKLNCALHTCTYTGIVAPDDSLVLTFRIDVAVDAPASLTNVVHVSGGGAPDASMSTPTQISVRPASFGISAGGASTALSTVQAGAHPDLTTSIAFNTVNSVGALAGDPKNTVDELPPGFAGDLVDTPVCSIPSFTQDQCAIGTQIGVSTLTLDLDGKPLIATEPVYNLAPNYGAVAKIGFPAVALKIQGDVRVRPGDYGLQASFEDIEQSVANLDNVSLTIWGVPSDPIHDSFRWNPDANGGLGGFGVSTSAPPTPLLTNPTSCGTEALDATFSVDSWEDIEQNVVAGMPFGPIVGCDRLGMEPSLTAVPTTTLASSPTGLDLTTSIPQTYENAYGLATSTLKRAVVTLPEGMTVNPSAGTGLQACTTAEFEAEALEYSSEQGCPKESKLGVVKIVTPAIKEDGTGSVYIAQPYDNPFGSLLALYVVARFPERGVLVKVAGQVTADPRTGRLVTTFDNLPPLPFSKFTFSFRQGQTSPLVTPPSCGLYTVQAELSPWAVPSQLLSPLIPPFEITGGFDGGPCPSGGVPPFSPTVTAGTLDNEAGSYSPFDIRIIRNDGEQEITGFASQLPPGLTANLTGVPFCSEADIALARTKTGAQEEAEPSCPGASQIGHTLVGAGVGSVLAYSPGRIYMAGPFEGGPFSIVAIASAKVGPFDLGTVVVHLPLQINPTTAAVNVAAGESDQIPHIIDGIVIHVRDIRVYIDRPGFMLNPTNCNPMTFSATVIGSGARFMTPADDSPVTVIDPFQAANCSRISFKPDFNVSTSGKTSRVDGAGLIVKLSYPRAPEGSQANIAQVKVDLPKQLPSRLTTLQKACLAARFDENPAKCPPGSKVGVAKAITPILPVPLEGPAYFVSHGGTKFPELIVVLQGYGVTVDLHGETFIGKGGVTSSAFRGVPDVPVGRFDLSLPEGPDSALAANANLCNSKLVMHTAFTAQNGLVIHQLTKIAVSGCPKAKKPSKERKRRMK